MCREREGTGWLPLSVLPLSGCLFDLPAYYSSLEMLDVASLSQPCLFLSAYFSLSAAFILAQMSITKRVPTYTPATEPQTAPAQPTPKHRVPGPGDAGGSVGPLVGQLRGSHPCQMVAEACRMEQYNPFPRPEGEVSLSHVGYRCLMLQIRRNTAGSNQAAGEREGKESVPLSAPHSALSSLCSGAHCLSIHLGSAERGACEHPDTPGLQRDPLLSATHSGAIAASCPASCHQLTRVTADLMGLPRLPSAAGLALKGGEGWMSARPELPGQRSSVQASGICCNVNNSNNPSEVVLATPEPPEEASPHPCDP